EARGAGADGWNGRPRPGDGGQRKGGDHRQGRPQQGRPQFFSGAAGELGARQEREGEERPGDDRDQHDRAVAAGEEREQAGGEQVEEDPFGPEPHRRILPDPRTAGSKATAARRTQTSPSAAARPRLRTPWLIEPSKARYPKVVVMLQRMIAPPDSRSASTGPRSGTRAR